METEESKPEMDTNANETNDGLQPVPTGGVTGNGVRRLAENNIGHRLLCQMGWKGIGGIGKHEDGISDPIEAKGHSGKCTRGIGFEPPGPPRSKRQRKEERSTPQASVGTSSRNNSMVTPHLPAQPLLPVKEIPGFVLWLPEGTSHTKLRAKTKKEYIDKSCMAVNYSLKLVKNEKAGNSSGKLVSVDLFINDLFVSSAAEKQYSDAVLLAYEKLFDVLLQRQPIKYVGTLSKSSSNDDSKSNLTHHLRLLSSSAAIDEELIPGFVLLLPSKKHLKWLQTTAGSHLQELIIRGSCDECNKLLHVQETNEPDGEKMKFRCTILIDEIVVGSLSGQTANTTKTRAFQDAYSKLTANPKVRKHYSSLLTDVIKEEIKTMSRGFKRTITVIKPNATITTSMSTQETCTTSAISTAPPAEANSAKTLGT